MARKHVGLLLVAVLSLGGCATKPLPSGLLGQIHTVGVISAIDERVTRESIALLAFGNEITDGDVSDWHINGDVAAAIEHAVTPRFTAIPLEAERTPVKEDLLSRPILSLGDSGPARTEAVPKPGHPAVDAIIMVQSTSLTGAFGTNQTVTGLSVYSHAGSPIAVAPLIVSVLDGRTNAVLAEARATPADWSGPAAISPLPDSLKHDRWDDYTPAEREALRQVFVKLAVSSVIDTLKQLNMTE